MQLFLPDDLHDTACNAGDGLRAYGWGKKRGSAAVVMGVVRASTAQEAAQLVEARFADRSSGEQQVVVLAELGTKVSDATAVTFLDEPHPTMLSVVGPPAQTLIPVLYSPLKHLEILSLRPLRLNFDSPTMRAGSTSPRKVASRLSSREGEDALANAVSIINGSRLILQDWRRTFTEISAPAHQPPGLIPRAGLFLSTAIHIVLSLLVRVLSYRVPLIGSFADISCFGRQLDTRLSQALSLVPTFSSFRRDLREPSTAEVQYVAAHATYIHFFNLLWLLANDFIVGVALAVYVRDNAEPIRRLTNDLVEIHVLAYLRDLLGWLNSWPMGIKLNDEVAGVICRAFLFLSQVWEDVVLAPALSRLPVGLIGCAGFLGASSLLALAADLFSLLTLPFFLCYAVATLVYSWSLRSLAALFNVFRGRKYNPLRSRVEPATYDVDALLLGTILFVTLSFVFPTLAAFYGAFASSRLFILAVETALLMGVAALNAFPLFALLLRAKSPGRLPGGIQLDSCEDKKHWPTPHLHLRNQPLSFGDVLSSLSRVLGDSISPRASLTLFGRLCTGRVIWSPATVPPLQTRS